MQATADDAANRANAFEACMATTDDKEAYTSLSIVTNGQVYSAPMSQPRYMSAVTVSVTNAVACWASAKV